MNKVARSISPVVTSTTGGVILLKKKKNQQNLIILFQKSHTRESKVRKSFNSNFRRCQNPNYSDENHSSNGCVYTNLQWGNSVGKRRFKVKIIVHKEMCK